MKNSYLKNLGLSVILLSIFCISSGCEKVLGPKTYSAEPIDIFNEVWQLIDSRYALFEVKQVNWDSTYAKYRGKVTDNMNERDLFSVITAMLGSLKDGHVTLLAPFDSSTYQGYYNLYPPNFNFNLVKQQYLRNDYRSIGPFLYKVVDSVGYIYYSSFQDDISDNALDSLFKMIAKTKGIIVDIRNNAGGSSLNSDKLFRQFINARKLTKYEKGKKGPGRLEFLDPEPFYLNPGAHYYSKKICLLTNRRCFSTANDFAMYMSDISNVLLVGDQTGGGGGIPYDVQLKNGWKLQYTATVTLSPQRHPIEFGISPDIPLQITSIDEANGRDPIIERAFDILK